MSGCSGRLQVAQTEEQFYCLRLYCNVNPAKTAPHACRECKTVFGCNDARVRIVKVGTKRWTRAELLKRFNRRRF